MDLPLAVCSLFFRYDSRSYFRLTSKHVYDAAQLVTEIEGAIANLTSTMRRIEVTQGFSEVLDEAQLDEVYCAAVILSASVTEYLAKAIEYLEANVGTCPCLQDLTNFQ